MPASIVAVPWAGCALTLKVGGTTPSASAAVSVPVIVPASSAPLPAVAPPNTVGSLTGDTVTVTVAVSVTPPEVTV
ncbi:hypothetical protein HK414_02905 [Ramlibacter terrae]|uniref:Uncharacterized protein n=1 Tax=Ramlibacter terrae TaxID=2732511 RepID=A0ABX6P252_9BURK|nr:hypothetical protein HK414_02905 [Ramlibacter terrae]